MNPSFHHPADHLLRVYVILDVCHKLKLLRNSFADGLILNTSDGETIRWKYIEELNKLQETEGLRLGNKLKIAHIQWKKQKMKAQRRYSARVWPMHYSTAMKAWNCHSLLAVRQQWPSSGRSMVPSTSWTAEIIHLGKAQRLQKMKPYHQLRWNTTCSIIRIQRVSIGTHRFPHNYFHPHHLHKWQCNFENSFGNINGGMVGFEVGPLQVYICIGF